MIIIPDCRYILILVETKPNQITPGFSLPSICRLNEKLKYMWLVINLLNESKCAWNSELYCHAFYVNGKCLTKTTINSILMNAINTAILYLWNTRARIWENNSIIALKYLQFFPSILLCYWLMSKMFAGCKGRSLVRRAVTIIVNPLPSFISTYFSIILHFSTHWVQIFWLLFKWPVCV